MMSYIKTFDEIIYEKNSVITKGIKLVATLLQKGNWFEFFYEKISSKVLIYTLQNKIDA